MSAKHTPIPWYVGEGKAARIIYAADVFVVADTTVFHGRHDGVDAAEANAELIVRAVNAHAAMVAALERVITAADVAINGHMSGADRDRFERDMQSRTLGAWRDNAIAALKLAKVE